jgi:hypothetical protein
MREFGRRAPAVRSADLARWGERAIPPRSTPMDSSVRAVARFGDVVLSRVRVTAFSSWIAVVGRVLLEGACNLRDLVAVSQVDRMID